jgi:hypothetical protein
MSYVKSPVELGLVTDTTGIYSMTEETWIDAMKSTGFLQFGLGDTVEATIAERQLSLSSSKNVSWQKYLLDTIPEPGYRDHALHKVVRQSIAAQLPRPDSNRHSELFKIAVEKYLIEEFVKSKDFEPIRLWLNEKIRKCAAKLNPNHEKQAVNLRNIQILVIKKVISALRQNGVVTNFVCELAARIGKTILFLELAKTMQEEFGHESMFIMAYGVGLSVKTSYKDEIGKYIDFAYLQFIDATEADAEEQYKQAIADSKMPVVFISLNPEVEAKYEWINKLAGTHIALLEETDFGTHTDSQVEKVDYILENKTVTRINASGTNIGRLAKAFGKNAIDEIISVPYCMVEQDSSIPNVVVRRFYNMLFSGRINKLLEDFDKDLLPNLTKILAKPYSQQKFITALFQDIFGYQPIYGFNISDQAGEEIKNSMLFVNISKLAMDQLAEVIEKACPEHKVLILNGDYTDNKEAEGLTKEELVRMQNGYYEGRDKLLVITNMMGTRSYSIPEIQACLFMQEGGDVYPYMQKYSRCLTPGFGKKLGHIFDFAFDQSKTRNSVMSVAVEAALLIRQKGKTYPEAVREVMNSVNIKDMISGQWIDAEEVIKQFEDNNKLLEIANAHTRITIEDLTSEDREDLGELAKRSTSSKEERSKIDKIVATGKTFESNHTPSGRLKKDPLKAIVEKAIRMINGSATTILALSNYEGESFLECIDIIENNIEMYQEFIELYGIKPASIKRLSPRLEISTLDMIVRMSKYNTTQKHIENNALAILKDDATLWFEIFGNRKLKRFIKSKHCKRILVVAGGHGSEIDVLVDMFGIDIIDKIVYNDKYSFLCNQIKRKYPGIVVMQGDFIELEFDMKFDVIVGNPPYQDSRAHGKKTTGNGALWVRFTVKAIDLVKDNGFLGFVIPDSWTAPTYDLMGSRESIFNDYFKKNNLLYLNFDVKKFFPSVGIDPTAFLLKKDQNYTGTTIKTPIETINLDLSNMSFITKDLSTTSLSIHSKVLSNKENSRLFKMRWKKTVTSIEVQELKDQNFKYPFVDHHSYKPTRWANTLDPDASKRKVLVPYVGKYQCIVDDAGVLGARESVSVLFLQDIEKGDFAERFFTSKLINFVMNTNQWTQYQLSQILNYIPVEDFSQDWNDNKIYKHFGLTQEEIDYVEANVK